MDSDQSRDLVQLEEGGQDRQLQLNKVALLEILLFNPRGSRGRMLPLLLHLDGRGKGRVEPMRLEAGWLRKVSLSSWCRCEGKEIDCC